MKKLTFVLIALGVAWGSAQLQDEADVVAWLPMGSAHAIVGRPLTPVSVAGVARRTTRRMIVATSVYVATLPPSCQTVVVEGTPLYLCGNTYYQAKGTQYVVVNVS
jgi:hypothetical protein